MHFGILLLFIVVAIKNSLSNTQKKISVVYSYEIDHTNPIEQAMGIRKGIFRENLYEGINLNIQEFWMNTKTDNISNEKKKNVAKLIISKIYEFQPELVFAFDDNAFNFVGRKLFEDFPVLFGGLNLQPEVYNDSEHHFLGNNPSHPIKSVTGIFEPVFFIKGIKFLVSIIPSIKEPVNGIKPKVLILYDSTETGIGIYNETLREINETKFEQGTINMTILHKTIATFQELKDILLEANKDPSITLLVPYIFSLQKTENNMDSIGSNEIISYISKNWNRPELSIHSGYCQSGLFGGVGVSHIGISSYLGQIAGKYLNNEIKIEDIPIVQRLDAESTTFINKNRAEELGITVNPIILNGVDSVFYVTEDLTWLYWVIVISVFSLVVVIIVAVSLFIFLLLISGFSVCIAVKKKKDREIHRIVEFVSLMDLHHESIIKLENKKKKNKIETLLTYIVDSLRMIRPYIPNFIMKIEEDEKEGMKFPFSLKNDSSEALSSIFSSEYSWCSDEPSSVNKRKLIKEFNEKTTLIKKEISFSNCILTGVADTLFKHFDDTPKDLVVVLEFYTSLLNKFVEIVDTEVLEYKGVVHFVDGFHIKSSWNSVNVVINHYRNACSSGTAIIKRWKHYIESLEKSKNFPKEVRLSIRNALNNFKVLFYVDSFNGFIGTVGGKHHKFFTTYIRRIDAQVDKIHESLKSENLVDNAVLITNNHLEKIKYYFFYQYVLEVKLMQKHVCCVYPMNLEVENVADWDSKIYTFQHKNPYKMYNKAYEYFMHGKFEDARVCNSKFLLQYPMSVLGKKLKHKIPSKENGEVKELPDTIIVKIKKEPHSVEI